MAGADGLKLINYVTATGFCLAQRLLMRRMENPVEGSGLERKGNKRLPVLCSAGN